jgi:gluconolactonase
MSKSRLPRWVVLVGIPLALLQGPEAGAVRAAEPGGELARKLQAARFELYARAPEYTEGPTWRDGELFFCSGALLRVARDGKVAKYLDIKPAGTVLRGDGHLLICDNKHRALLDLSPDGVLAVLADRFEGKPLNSLNDLTIDARGNVYWTDPDGSSVAKPVGNIFRVRPDGVVSKVATGLAFPNGLDVDPKGEYLYVIESQSKKVLRYQVPPDDQPLGRPESFFDLGGSGGDGCVFDAAGNLWVADFRRPDTKRGRITVLSPRAEVLGRLEVPAEVVSNIAFGGPKGDEIFCTTGGPPAVFRCRVGVPGFRGHPGKAMKPVRLLPVAPEELASPLHPRRFGHPGGVGPTRGWYVWHRFDPDKWTAEVSHEGTGTRYSVRVLPWATTYRYLVYGAHPQELLPGERVNLFFAPDEKQTRGYLVHFQDELCQMKGHGHVWEVRSVAAEGREFTARVLAGDKPLDDKVLSFRLDANGRHWRGGKAVENPQLRPGERLYLTWAYREGQRLVLLTVDEASLDALKRVEQETVARRFGAEGLAAHVEAIEGEVVHLLVFPTYWSQAAQWQEGQALTLRATTADLRPTGEALPAKLLTRKNLGTYGSGATEVSVRLSRPAPAPPGKALAAGMVVRVLGK